MVRPLSLLPAVVAVVALLAPSAAIETARASPGSVPGGSESAATTQARSPVVSRSASTRRAEGSEPLSVSIDSLSPSTVPVRGPVLVTGSVTNEDDAAWTGIRVYAFVSDQPLTTAAELADAAQTDPAEPVGERITAPGTYDSIDELAPGASRQFSIRVPRALLGVTEQGVYWFGVHALGTGDEPDPLGAAPVADGRARTFLPFVSTTRRQVDAALVLPLRHDVTYAADGTLDGVQEWIRTLSPGGELRSMVDLGISAGSRRITWLVDPAVIDAARRLAAGNPPRSLAPTIPLDGSDGSDGSGGSDGESPGTDPSGSASPAPTVEAVPDDAASAAPVELDAEGEAARSAATTWLERLREGLKNGQVLALPYGDLDLAGAAAHDPTLYTRARTRSAAVMEEIGVPASPAVAAPNGYLDAAGIRLAGPDPTVLISDRMLGERSPGVADADGRKLVVTSAGTATGGPGPDDRLGAVALRQRILAEAAVRLLGTGRVPLVVSLPESDTPTATTEFYSGLDVDWLDLASVGAATSTRDGRPVDLDALEYPTSQTRAQLEEGNFAAARALIRTGTILESTLTRNDQVATVVHDEALTSTSYAARLRPDAAREGAERSAASIRSQLGQVVISAPNVVRLSSATGGFSATIVNGLDQPVTISIRAETDQALEITGQDTIVVPAGGRNTVLLTARTDKLGIHNVTLSVTDEQGQPLGSSFAMAIRSDQVSQVIWLILGVGLALLFGAIALRLVRRVLGARRQASADEPADPADPADPTDPSDPEPSSTDHDPADVR